MRLVVVEEDSNSLREQLRRCGFDYLIRRPVHPEALRLLLLRCLYRGDERRREPRVAVGFEVTYRTGLKTRRAVLADLSVRGCRLVSESGIDAGRRIRVNVPEALETGDPVAITGRVLRVDRPRESDRAHLYTAAVVFDEMSTDSRQALEMVIEDLSMGPATLRRGLVPRAMEAPAAPPFAKSMTPASDEALDLDAVDDTLNTPPDAPEQPATETETETRTETAEQAAIEVDLCIEDPSEDAQDVEAVDAIEAVDTEGSDRRSERRAAYSHTVPAFSKRALRVLVGRDLSSRGMRIDPLPGLEIDDRLHLAIYGDAGESPFLVWATVRRDDGDSGMALAFDPLDREIADRLERLVGSLPAVESLHDTEAEAMGTVVSEILTE
jgi:hypothetical protein